MVDKVDVDYGVENFLLQTEAIEESIKKFLSSLEVDILKPSRIEYYPEYNHLVNYNLEYYVTNKTLEEITEKNSGLIEEKGILIFEEDNNIIIQIPDVKMEWLLEYSYSEVIKKENLKKLMNSKDYLKKGIINIIVPFVLAALIVALLIAFSINDYLIPVIIVIALPFIMYGGYKIKTSFVIRKSEKKYLGGSSSFEEAVKEALDIFKTLGYKKTKVHSSWYITNEDFYFIYSIKKGTSDNSYYISLGINPKENMKNDFIYEDECYYNYDFLIESPKIKESINYLEMIKNSYFKSLDVFETKQKEIEKLGLNKIS